MKSIVKLLLILLLSFMSLTMSVFSVECADPSEVEPTWKSSPGEIINALRDPCVQNTAVDGAWNIGGLEDSAVGLKVGSVVYMQWMAYLWLGIALLAIIYNGIILLINLWDKSKVGVVKKRLISITVWVVLVVGAYFVLELVLSLISNMTP